MADDLGWLLLFAVAALALGTAALALWAIRLHGRLQNLARDLLQAQQQLERTHTLSALGEMTSSFAHGFNDVLTPIIGRTQLLSQRVTDPQLLEWIGNIESSAMKGARTVRRIQDFLRSRRDEHTVPVDLGEIAGQAGTSLAARQRPSVHIRVGLESRPTIAGDPVALREALNHVLLNAVEASPDGATVLVTVRMEAGDAVLSVTDTGNGMAPEVQARMFEPFFTTRQGATGLGLSLAHGIVARHGGQIEVDSAPGRGTTIRMRFPVEGPVAAAQAATARGAAPGGAAARPAPEVPAGPARCLVVDDDPQVRDMIRDMLANAGHKVVLAVDGADGVEKFKAEPVDIVISDLAMPRLNGLQLARVCKTIRPEVPVVMLTGWGVLLTEDELADHGVDEVLSKPVRMDQVLSTVAAMRKRAAEA